MIFSASSRSLEPKCHCVWILGSKSIMDDQSAAYTQHTLHSSSWELRKRYFTLTSSGSRRRLTVCFMLSLDLAHVSIIFRHPLHFSSVACCHSEARCHPVYLFLVGFIFYPGRDHDMVTRVKCHYCSGLATIQYEGWVIRGWRATHQTWSRYLYPAISLIHQTDWVS